MGQTRIGLIGAGLLGLTHGVSLAIIKNAGLCDLELVSVFDPNGAAADSLVKNIGFKRTAASADEIIDHDGIDTVFIASPTRFHKQCVIDAARRGKNVFCEKPLDVDVEGAREMGKAVLDAGVTAGVGLVLHYSPSYRFIRNMIAENDAGLPIMATLRDDQCFPIRGLHHSSWRADRSISGGGALIEHSIHDLDLLAWFFGRPRITDSAVEYRTKHDGIEDYARVTMSFDNGMDGLLTSVWHDMVSRVSNRRLEIMYERLFIATDHDIIGPVEYTKGDAGQLIVDRERVLSSYLDDLGLSDPFFQTLDYQTFGPYTVEDYFFIRAVQERTEYSPGFAAAVTAHELVDEVYRRSGERRDD